MLRRKGSLHPSASKVVERTTSTIDNTRLDDNTNDEESYTNKINKLIEFLNPKLVDKIKLKHADGHNPRPDAPWPPLDSVVMNDHKVRTYPLRTYLYAYQHAYMCL